jgi:hypothetical protein
VRQRLQELRGSQAEAAESASCGGCRSSLSRLLWAFKKCVRQHWQPGQLLLEQRASEVAQNEGGGLQDQPRAEAARAA